MEETTTEAATQDTQAQEIAQPEEQSQAEAVQTADSEPTTTTEPEAETTEEPASAENSDDDLADYWSKKGIDITTPEGQRKAAQSYREAEKALSQKSQKASELQKQLQTQPVEEVSNDPLVQDLATKVVLMERAQQVNDFMREVNLTGEQEQKMAQYLTDNPAKAQLVNAGYMSLNEVYQLSGAASESQAKLKQAGGREALEKLANKQLATRPQGNATTHDTPKEDPIAAALAD